MICIARTFGAPDTVPAGKHDASASSRSLSSASWPSTTDTRCITCEYRSSAMKVGTRTLPYSTHAAQIVAAEIDEHDVLGALLLVPLQLVGQALIFLVGPAARPRSGDGMGHRMPSFHAHQHLG